MLARSRLHLIICSRYSGLTRDAGFGELIALPRFFFLFEAVAAVLVATAVGCSARLNNPIRCTSIGNAFPRFNELVKPERHLRRAWS